MSTYNYCKSDKKGIKVAHIGWLASSHLVRRAAELAKRGVYTVVFTDSIPEHFDEGQSPFAVEILPLHLRTKPQELLNWLELRLAIHGINILHIHSTHFPASLGFFVKSVPRLVSIWDFVYSKDNISPLFHKVILDQLFHRNLADFISFSSKAVMEKWIATGYPSNHAFWHSWGVNLTHFSVERDPYKIQSLRQCLGIGAKERVIFCPRTPSLTANDDLLIQALPLLDETDNVKCIITGHAFPPEARYLERLLRQPEISEKVIFVDTIHEQTLLNLYYQMADVVVSLHSNDHNPATVLEAMAVGALVIINESSSVEYWIQDGRNGFVVRTRDRGHLVSQVNRAFSMPRKTILDWQKFNHNKIAAEADFSRTISQVMGDYRLISQNVPRHSESNFDKGLLADILNHTDEALHWFQKASQEKKQSAYLEKLIKEKKHILAGIDGVASFHLERAEPCILKIRETPQENWEKVIEALGYPKSLYRHDVVAGFYPLLRDGHYSDILSLVEILSRRFSTGTFEWLAETVNWFGNRWHMWEECAGLLGQINDGGTSLGVHALQVAKELGTEHPQYLCLLEKSSQWTMESIECINPALDKQFRHNVYKESHELIATSGKAA